MDYGNFDNRLGAAARASIGGVEHGQNPQFVRIGEDRFIDAIILLSKGVNQIENKRILHEAQLFLASTVVKERLQENAAYSLRLGSEITRRSLGRLPFVTKKGHLALSSYHVQRGDVIALIKGAQVPFVLRCQKSGKYRIISEAYVDGIMDGEAVRNGEYSSFEIV
ncbi:hypothetical protein BU24DRAFT_360404 [Aaosphaeria arxii CBS 175.79]|uniref:Heterokaryon incompatibility protein 6, OR allele n=1 Tax=Aaosphaeria arxii CBS 175.79 TaxID=1450172 RepID=A0A6A5X6L6_9PLEO|nr:uncharacterized protein BU24DRAFT_360404 [Aaosphaeria arxii CBS 175.79]KAF2008542.1 hypothetical protein BU24DRAFT_360404 [Aaosphaeria arxii CBS 175.79]